MLEPPISDHYSIELPYKLNVRNKGIVWKAFSFDEISSRNSSWVFIEGIGAIYEKIVEIGSL